MPGRGFQLHQPGMARMATNNGHNAVAPGTVNLAFIEGLYEEYLRNPDAVPPDWRPYFAQIAKDEFRFPKPRFGPSFRPFSIFNPPAAPRRRSGSPRLFAKPVWHRDCCFGDRAAQGPRL